MAAADPPHSPKSESGRRSASGAAGDNPSSSSFRHPGITSDENGVVSIQQPTSTDEWDRFITSYSMGAFISSQFPKDQSEGSGGEHSSDSPHSRIALASTNHPSPSGSSTLIPKSNIHSPAEAASSTSTPLATPFSDRRPSFRPLSTPTGSNTPSSNDVSHTDLSSAGPTNQDPNIPNIDTPDLPDDDHPKNPSTMFKEKVKGDKEAKQESGGLTHENMRQLNLQTSSNRRSDDQAAQYAHIRKRKTKSKEAEKRSSPRKDSTVRQGRRGSAEGTLSRDSSDSDDDDGRDPWISSNNRNRPPRPPRKPRSRGSIASYSRAGSVRGGSIGGQTVDEITSAADHLLLESATGTSHSGSIMEFDYNIADERTRMREFFEENGYLPPPKQTPDAKRRRLRVLRRLGLGDHEIQHKIENPNTGLDRFTRLAVSFTQATSALITIIGKEKQWHLSRVNFPATQIDLRTAFCSHSIVSSGEECLVIPDAAKDWRFRKNPLVDEGRGPLQSYAGAPLVIGRGARATIIGSLCVIDNRAREFTEEHRNLLKDLASCVVGELELSYTQQASIESAKLHQISVDFLRRSLKSRPTEHAGRSRLSTTQTQSSHGSQHGKHPKDTSSSKRKHGADHHQSDEDIDIYDEACSEIRHALEAYAVAVVDLSQFHLFYPAFQGSSTAGTSTKGGSSTTKTQSIGSKHVLSSGGVGGRSTSFDSASAATGSATSTTGMDDPEAYAKEPGTRRARKTYALTDPTAPSRTPQVLYIPEGRRTDFKQSRAMRKMTDHRDDDDQDLAVLGYSCAHDDFAFNFTSSPQAKKVIADFIASNVKTRQVWYNRDDSEGIAQSITRLMPPGTETSLAMPIFGFDGQVAFAVVACWTDPLYTYPAGSMQFVETIAGSLLASVMKERLHQAERAQLKFAAAASHELRTPLHQINAAVSLLRFSLRNALNTPAESPEMALTGDSNASIPSETDLANLIAKHGRRHASISPDDRSDALSQLDIIETNGIALGSILENLIDTLDIGKMTSRLEEKVMNAAAAPSVNPDGTNRPNAVTAPIPIVTQDNRGGIDLSRMIEDVMMDAVSSETKSRRVAGVASMDDIEVILEVLPRHRGGWKMAQDPGPLSRALGKIIHNACKFTDKGYIHIIVQDVSRDIVLPAGYDNSVKTSIVAIDIKDSGRGMSPEFLEREVLRPFAKADAFSPGSGLGLGLAQRMIELLGGKLAIASTLGKGTLVHVELPIHLLNDDNDSDQDEMNAMADASVAAGGPADDGERGAGRMQTRQDGIYLVGFDSKEHGVKRVGKSLLRQLKLNFCRVVQDIQYASLLLAPETIDREALLELAGKARPKVEIITLSKRRIDAIESRLRGIGRTPSPELRDDLPAHLRDMRVQKLSRPLRPTIMSVIMRPPIEIVSTPPTYISPVVGDGSGDYTSFKPNEGPSPGHMPHSISQVMSEDPIRHSPADPPRLRSERPVFDRNQSYNTSATDRSVPSSDSAGYFGNILPSPPTQPTSPHSGVTSVSPLTSPALHRPELGSATMSDPFSSVRSRFEGYKMGDRFKGEVGEPRRGIDRGEKNQDSSSQSLEDSRSRESSSSGLGLPSNSSSEIDDGGDGDGSGNGGAEGDVEMARNRRGTTRPQPRLAQSADLIIPSSEDDGDDKALRVLVVEDNAVNRKILITMLKRTSCKYAEAADGYEAVTQFKVFRPDCVLLDINMPRKDGFQASKEIRSIERQETRKPCVIIAVTAMSSEAHRRKGLFECGIDVWKSKPVSIKELKDDVERLKGSGGSGLGDVSSGGGGGFGDLSSGNEQ